jgi:ferredoxin-NADP reductase
MNWHRDENFNCFLIFFNCGSPIRSLIESGFNENKKAEVRLYYGARNLERMAYQVCLFFHSYLVFVTYVK